MEYPEAGTSAAGSICSLASSMYGPDDTMYPEPSWLCPWATPYLASGWVGSGGMGAKNGIAIR